MTSMTRRRRPSRLLLTGAIVAVAASTLTPLLMAPASASAGITMRAAAAALTPDRRASDEEKANAVAVLGIVADEKWLIYNDRDFVAAIILTAPETLPEVRAAGQIAWFSDDADAVLTYIQFEIYEAKARDDAKIIRDAETLRQERDLRRSAASTIGVVTDERMLTLTRSDFLHELSERASGPKVKAAALAAMDAASDQQVEFLQTKIKDFQQQDVADAIAQDQNTSAAEKSRLLEMAAKARAAATVLGVIISEGTQSLSDDNFLRFIRRESTNGWQAEVNSAAFVALDSSDPADWKAFIHTGIYAANQRDIDREQKAKTDADRAQIQTILTQAEAEGRKNLAVAARTALAGTRVDYDTFLRVGRHNVPADLPDTIKASHSGLCLTIIGVSKVADAEAAQGTCNGKPEQQWELATIATGKTRIRNMNSQLCLTIRGAVKTVGANIVQATCNGKAEQWWNIQKDNSGMAQIQNNHSLLCLVVNKGSKASGARALQQTCAETDEQMWQIHSRGLINLASGEFTGDDHDDLLAVQIRDGVLWLYPGTEAGGSFGTRKAFPGNWSGMSELVVGKFNRDDQDDLIAVETATGKLWLYPGTGTNKFGTRIEIGASGWAAMEGLAVGRFTRDSYDDLVAVDPTGVMRLYTGTAAGTRFDGPLQINQNVSGAVDYTGGEFNGDHYDDLLSVNLADGALQLKRGTVFGLITGTVSTVTPSGWTGYHELTAGKFNRDDYDDIITFEQATSKLWLYPGSAAGFPAKRVEIGIGG